MFVLYLQLYLSLSGIMTIGLSLLFCYGIAMACGVLYGPIHNIMPFLLLGKKLLDTGFYL